MAVILNLEDYQVSEKTGFLLEDPLDRLPEYFEPWSTIGHNLGPLTESGKLREAVDAMPLLEHGSLQGEKEHHLAYAILANMGNCYILQDRATDVMKVLPKQIAIPLYGVSKVLGVKPGLTITSTFNSNYTLLDPQGPMRAENFEPTVPMPGGMSAKWLTVVSFEIYIAGQPAIQALPQLLLGCSENNIGRVKEQLGIIKGAIRAMTAVMKRFHEHMDPTETVTDVLPYIEKWGGELSSLPQGLIYDGVEGNKPITMPAGNPSVPVLLICALDAVLRVRHSAHDAQRHGELVNYTLPAHKQFIQAIRNAPSLHEFVESRESDATLVGSYNSCLQELGNWRSLHVQIVAKYVTTAKYRATSPFCPRDAETMLLIRKYKEDQMKFLKACRDNTMETKFQHILTTKL